MELSITILGQVGTMFLLIAVGFLLAKLNIITERGSREMTDILLLTVTPCVLVSAYQTKFDITLAKGLLLAAGISLLIQVVGILIATPLFRKEPTLRYRVNIFAAVYSNCGFMGIPLLREVLGNQGVFFGSAYLAVFTVLYWTHGVYVMTGDRKQISLRKTVLNPGVIGVFLGLLLFVLRVRLPEIVLSGVNYMASLNTPLAMLVLGVFLSRIDFRKTLKNKGMYAVNFVRLLLIPILAVFIFKGLHINQDVMRAVVLCAACPTATVTTLFAAKFDLDALHASEVVATSTLFSVLTVPIVMLLCSV